MRTRAARLTLLASAALLLLAGCSPRSTTGSAPTATAVRAPSATPTPSSPSGQLPDVPLERGDAARGEQLFSSTGCVGCHAVKGNGGQIGPDLTEVARRAPSRAQTQGLDRPELYFVESIVDPRAYLVEGYSPVMLDWKQMKLSEQDLADLVAYLSTLDGR